jgi:hypothetical protein
VQSESVQRENEYNKTNTKIQAINESIIVNLNELQFQVEKNKDLSDLNMSILASRIEKNYDTNFNLLKNVSEALIDGGTDIFKFLDMCKCVCIYVYVYVCI